MSKFVWFIDNDLEDYKYIAPDIEVMIGRNLERYTSLESAKIYLADNIPDLIILDWLWGEKTASSFLQWLRTQPKLAHTPVLVYTNGRIGDVGFPAYAMGANVCAEKRWDKQVILAIIKNLLIGPSIAFQENPVILHLSDIQWGADLESSNLDRADGIWRPLENDIMKGYTRDGIPMPNCVVISGDLTNKGEFKRYKEVEEFLDRLCAQLNIPRARVAMVPGNHDFDYNISKFGRLSSPSNFRSRDSNPNDYYHYRFVPFAQFFNHFYGGAYWYTLEPEKMYTIYDWMQELGLIIVGFNSCEETDHKNPKHACISTNTLTNAFFDVNERYQDYLQIKDMYVKLREYQNSLPMLQKKIFKIAVWHYALLNRDEPTPIYHRTIIERLNEEDFSLYMHGDIHEDYSSIFGRPYAVGAGSLNAPPEDRPPNWSRQYKVLAFDLTTRKVTIYGRILLGNQWVGGGLPDGKSSIEYNLA
ncbi:hypothetical protein FJZ31_24365 [Candidatus Poribacteria bacterium]|nr:hypothetical protein [Candidatus Poribacteria bacterium]